MYLVDNQGRAKTAVAATLRVRVEKDGTMRLSLAGELRGEMIEAALSALESAALARQRAGGAAAIA